jgi:hypothetical protein
MAMSCKAALKDSSRVTTDLPLFPIEARIEPETSTRTPIKGVGSGTRSVIPLNPRFMWRADRRLFRSGGLLWRGHQDRSATKDGGNE